MHGAEAPTSTRKREKQGTRDSSCRSNAGNGAGRGLVHEQGLRKRMIKSGMLRKAPARFVGQLDTTKWKTKYIELTPGRFSYADGSSMLGKRSDTFALVSLELAVKPLVYA